MRTVHIGNVPEEVYSALRKRARSNHRSIAAEIRDLLTENFPTARELRARRALLGKIRRMQAKKPLGPGPFPSTEEMQREDRLR